MWHKLYEPIAFILRCTSNRLDIMGLGCGRFSMWLSPINPELSRHSDKWNGEPDLPVATWLCLILNSTDSHPFCLSCNQNALDEKPSDEFKQDHKLQYIKLLAKLKGLLKEDDGNPKSVTNNIITDNVAGWDGGGGVHVSRSARVRRRGSIGL